MNMHGAHTGHGDQRALSVTGWLTGIYFVIELGIGLWTGSVSVTSDAFHTFSAVGGVLIALAASAIARHPASPTQTFALFRAEIVGALINGLFLAAMAIVVLWMGWMRLMDPIHLPAGIMLWTAAGGLVTEVISFALLFKRQKEDLNIQGAFWHVLQTLIGSLIIIVSAIVIHFTGFLAIDPILGMVFGLVLFWASIGIIRSSLNILLERTPSHLDLPEMIQAIREIPGVRDIHHVHAWSLTSGKDVFSAHVCVEDWNEGERIRIAADDLLRDRFHIYFSTIQIEKECKEEHPQEIDILRG